MAPNSNMMAYINRVDVEFRHEGHDAQHNEHAVPVQQQASCEEKKKNHRNYIRRLGSPTDKSRGECWSFAKAMSFFHRKSIWLQTISKMGHFESSWTKSLRCETKKMKVRINAMSMPNKPVQQRPVPKRLPFHLQITLLFDVKFTFRSNEMRQIILLLEFIQNSRPEIAPWNTKI